MESTYEYQGCVKVVVILLVEVPVILVRLPVEHLIKVPAGIRLFFCGRELFQYVAKGTQSVVKAGNALMCSEFAGQWKSDEPLAFCHL